MSNIFVGAIEPYGAQSHLTQSDIQYIDSLRSVKRQSEVASWRELLRRSISTTADILYHASGAPYIVGSDLFISASHSSTKVAIVVSSAPCAIDIESLSRDFERVASRYISIPELELNSGAAPLMALLWSAKETLYKLSPLDGLDLLGDIHVTKISQDVVTGLVKGCSGEVEMGYQIFDGHIILHTK